MIRSLPLRPVALACVAIVALASCAGTPNPRGIVIDLIESVEGPTDAQRACMLEKVDGYTDEEVEAIGAANVDVNFDDQEGALEASTPEFQAFVDDLSQCM